jgi:hypothetical protein
MLHPAVHVSSMLMLQFFCVRRGCASTIFIGAGVVCIKEMNFGKAGILILSPISLHHLAIFGVR